MLAPPLEKEGQAALCASTAKDQVERSKGGFTCWSIQCAALGLILWVMSAVDFPFEAVLFDLDGTLVATDRFWVPAARVGAKRAFAELGLDRELPTAEEWMGLVGLPLAEGFDVLFSDLSVEARLNRALRLLLERFRLPLRRLELHMGLQQLRRLGMRAIVQRRGR